MIITNTVGAKNTTGSVKIIANHILANSFCC